MFIYSSMTFVLCPCASQGIPSIKIYKLSDFTKFCNIAQIKISRKTEKTNKWKAATDKHKWTAYMYRIHVYECDTCMQYVCMRYGIVYMCAAQIWFPQIHWKHFKHAYIHVSYSYTICRGDLCELGRNILNIAHTHPGETFKIVSSAHVCDTCMFTCITLYVTILVLHYDPVLFRH